MDLSVAARRGRADHGFALIELLVVIIIIGILAAIAIPVYLNQRKKASDASMRSDLRVIATKEESYYADFQTYLASTSSGRTIVVGPETITLSPKNTATVVVNAAVTAFCVLVTNPAATNAPPAGMVYVSSAGGIQPIGTTACPASF